MLQELWKIDQGQYGLKPQLWPGQHPPVPAHLCVDESSLVSGTVRASTLFPDLEWPSSEPPPSYTAFKQLLKAYKDNATDIESLERQFLSSVSQTRVLLRARQMMKELADLLYSAELEVDQHWVDFLHKFWFTLPAPSLARPLDASFREPSFRDLLERYQSRKSTLSVGDVIELLAHKSAINPTLLGEPLATLQALATDKQREKGTPRQQSVLRLTLQMAEDLRYIDSKSKGSQGPFMHIFVGEYYESEAEATPSQVPLKGYHFWYKFHLDAYALPEAMEADGLRYGADLKPLGIETPELTTFAFTLYLQKGGRKLTLCKQLGGFFNGCSPEGWMAMCMVAFFRKRHAIRSRTTMPNMLHFETASGQTAQVELAVEYESDLLTTAFPVLWGSAP